MSTVMKSRQASNGQALALVQQPAPVALSDRAADMKMDMELAEMLAKSDLVPKSFADKPSNILIAVGLGRALGIDAIPSLYALHVIEGTPSPSAKTQQALVRRAGHKFRILESTDERAVAQIERHDDPGHPTTVEYSIEDAKRAGHLDRKCVRWVSASGNSNKRYPEFWVLPESVQQPLTPDALKAAGAPAWVTPNTEVKRKDNWFTNPKTMLVARATTAVVGQACSEVLSGLDFELTAPDDDMDDVEQLAALTSPPPAAPSEAPAPSADVVDAEIVPDTGASTSEGVADVAPVVEQPDDVGSAGADPSGQSEPEPVADEEPAEVVKPDPDPAPAPIADPNILGDDYTGANLTGALSFRKIRQANVLRHAAEVAESLGIPENERPGTVQQIAAHDNVNLRRAVAAFVNAGGEI